jgi:hypothetical protein|tara:strand:- start:474 stop:734 length:261 start_codon:yes stop_codon:yes gene_type:complete
LRREQLQANATKESRRQGQNTAAVLSQVATQQLCVLPDFILCIRFQSKPRTMIETLKLPRFAVLEEPCMAFHAILLAPKSTGMTTF